MTTGLFSRVRRSPLLLCSVLGLVAASADTAQSAGAAFTPDANISRDKIPDLYKWELAPLFKNDRALEKALEVIASNAKRIGRYDGKLGSASKLRECLDLYFETRLLANKATLYASMRQDSSSKSQERKANSEKSLQALKGFMTAASFIRQEVMGLDDKTLARFHAEEPRLEPFESYIREIRRRRSRLLSPETERVLAMGGDNLWAEIDLNELPSDFEKVFAALMSELQLPTIKDEHGKFVQLTLSNYGKFRASSVRRVRRDAVDGLFGALKAHENTLAATLAGQFNYNVYLARVRGYDSALDAYLDKDSIDPAVYRNMVKTISENLAPLHQYVRLRKLLMGLPDLHIYDLYVPLVEPSNTEYTYEQAREILPKALAPLGKEYVDTLRFGLDPSNGWIDIYPHKDKRSGAFSSSVYGTHPYVKMNYFNGLDDLSTLAHEYGHALHSHLSMNNQPYATFNYTVMLAETASTTNEKLLSDYLLPRAETNAERLYVLNQLVESIRTTVYRQALFAEFELAGHTAAEAGIPLTARFFNNTYKRLVRKYYGDEFTVGGNDEIEWGYIPHFYYKYYMYSYATGLSAGIALADRISSGDVAARDAYVNAIKAGSSKPPVKLLREAGVDLTKPDTVRGAAKVMSETLDEMSRLLVRMQGIAGMPSLTNSQAEALTKKREPTTGTASAD